MSVKEVRAQQSYELDINEDDEFIWEVTELNAHNFKKVFGFDPAFEEGDQQKIVIKKIFEAGNGWTLTLEKWDWKSNWEANGTISSNFVSSDPNEYDDNLFIPVPVTDYLGEADLASEYIIEGSKVTKRAQDYNLEMEYDSRGIKLSEAYIDDDGIIMVKVEGQWTIPLGEYFILFIGISIIAVIFIIIKNKKFQII